MFMDHIRHSRPLPAAPASADRPWHEPYVLGLDDNLFGRPRDDLPKRRDRHQ